MNKVRKYIEGSIGKRFIITTDIDKKKCESVICVVREAYKSLFVVEVENKDVPDKLRTFTYSDIYSHQVLIEEVN